MMADCEHGTTDCEICREYNDMGNPVTHGRPVISDDHRRLSPMGFRPTPAVREKLEQAAVRNCRSLSKEIEFRLEASFIHND